MVYEFSVGARKVTFPFQPVRRRVDADIVRLLSYGFAGRSSSTLGNKKIAIDAQSRVAVRSR